MKASGALNSGVKWSNGSWSNYFASVCCCVFSLPCSDQLCQYQEHLHTITDMLATLKTCFLFNPALFLLAWDNVQYW